MDKNQYSLQAEHTRCAKCSTGERMSLLFLADGPNEGLHVDQIAGHHAFFKQIGPDVTVEAQNCIVGFPVRLGLVVDSPAKRLSPLLDCAGFDEGMLLWVANETESRRKRPFIELQNAQGAEKVLEASLL